MYNLNLLLIHKLMYIVNLRLKLMFIVNLRHRHMFIVNLRLRHMYRVHLRLIMFKIVMLKLEYITVGLSIKKLIQEQKLLMRVMVNTMLKVNLKLMYQQLTKVRVNHMLLLEQRQLYLNLIKMFNLLQSTKKVNLLLILKVKLLELKLYITLTKDKLLTYKVNLRLIQLIVLKNM